MTPAPPFPVSPGEGVVFALPTVVASGPRSMGATNGSATATLSSMSLTMNQSRPTGNWMWAASWNGFTVPSSISGATINAIYPVFTGRGASFQAVAEGFAGNGMNVFDIEPTGLGLNFPQKGTFTGSFSTLDPTNSLGTTAGDVTSCNFGLRLFDTDFTDGFLDTFTASFVGLAIYYTPTPTVYGKQPVVSVSVGTTRSIAA